MIVIGIDCAANEKRVGLAYGSIDKQKVEIREVALGGRSKPVVDLIVKWLPKDTPALLALDAPLGWPKALASELSEHSAGKPLRVQPDRLFTRFTDRLVREKIGKRPLAVGADLIARTAHSALSLLQTLREKTGFEIPLTWKPDGIRETCAIEVYPAATLAVHGMNVKGYKKPCAYDERSQLLELFTSWLKIVTDRELLKSSPDAIDAVLCILAAHDFLLGKCLRPDDEKTAHKEGWIWVRNPKNLGE